MKKISLIIICVFLFSLSANAFEYEAKLENPTQEAAAKNLFNELRCIVCDGESLAGSNAEVSQDMRALIREKLKAGESEAQVKEFFIERYGSAILQVPPMELQTYFLWFAPLIFLVLGFFVIRRKK